ncbi:hypothetical protein EB118_15440 [bacterium]|nr:hypothetical protein [bacterium]NDD83669.1 hypothetical protein [bacterium]NDG31447.1 hypothetical protein [bacterium]
METNSVTKRVTFNDNCVYFETYSIDIYDRYPIESTIYKLCYKRISNKDWIKIHEELNKYKHQEMVVHKDSLHNTRFH